MYCALFILYDTCTCTLNRTWICETIDCLVTHSNGVMLLSMSPKGEKAVTSEAPLQHPVPMKVHSALIGVIDRLTSSQILLLKTASAICMGQGSGSILFDLKTVKLCFPIEEYADDIDSDIEYLCTQKLVHNYVSVYSYLQSFCKCTLQSTIC